MHSTARATTLFLVNVLTISATMAIGNAQPPSADRAAAPLETAPVKPQPTENDKRILGIIPNYRTYPSLQDYHPITARQKFGIATEDAFDRGTFVLAALFAGYGQIQNSNPSFGQGVKGYAHYFVTSYADWAIGDYMTEAVIPVMLHQDPRYFRRGTGGGPSRLLYAVSQIFWTHTDSGGHTFNFSEIGGNAAASAIGLAYYPDNRSGSEVVSKLGIQIGMDMASNCLKEFWPDLHRKLSRHPADQQSGGAH